MILTGQEIRRQVESGRITIDPFRLDQLNPNSYNYRLGATLLAPVDRPDDPGCYDYVEHLIPEGGYELAPGKTYLGHTVEVLGSDEFAMSLIGRSSIGRLGLFLQVSANLGHIGSCHAWTLELVAARPIILYPGMRIGQISFWTASGEADLYRHGYSRFNRPQCSKESAGFA
ncbi:dCTP deaminase [Roseateles sp.]|uniref:dCTP deaminase n=1 Tax=Roseateles sp. TaxID=1971397 RepID=UPI003D0A4E1C